MPQVTDDDVATGVRTHWAVASALNTLVSATRVYADRAAEKAARPYGVVEVEEEDREYFSGSAFLATYRVTLSAYTLADAANAGAIRDAMAAAFGGTASDPTAGLTVPNATVCHCLTRPGGSNRPTAERADGKDVIRATQVFEVLLQGTR